MSNMIIFLDIDGVLRRKGSPPDKFEGCCLNVFEKSLTELGSFSIVISSTWRLAYSLEQIRCGFCSEIRPFIIDSTPVSTGRTEFERYEEISIWRTENRQTSTPWVAIDDDDTLYPKHAPLIKVDATKGFDEACANQLLKMYASKA
jgi:hypothetical protein